MGTGVVGHDTAFHLVRPLGYRSCFIFDIVFPATFETVFRGDHACEAALDSRMRLLVEFFQNKGLQALKDEDRTEQWYQDWIDYQAKHQLYARFLTPSKYSRRGWSFRILDLVKFLEIFAFLSPSHAYSLHVTFLGVFPIFISQNVALIREVVEKLEEGRLFAFGISEKAHGADLLAIDSVLTMAGDEGGLASGSKYYIGNANCASMITVLAKSVGPCASDKPRRTPFVLFALRPQDTPAFQDLCKIRTLGVRSAFVGAFQFSNYPLPDSDVVARGREAWDAVARTVTLGKYFLGIGAVGICAHAFAEAIEHLQGRVLYGRPASELPHIRGMLQSAFARLTAMKLYAYRALDYLHSASDADSRYQLFCAVQKAIVSTQGVKVMALLSECVGARGFESDTYFESALRDAPMIPSLEGSTHINLRLTCRFIKAYFAGSEANLCAPPSVLLGETESLENPAWFASDQRNPKSVEFASYREAFLIFRTIANVRAFIQQAAAFHQFVGIVMAQMHDEADMAVEIAIGRCFSMIVYAQLIAEMADKARLPLSIVSVLFVGIIEDLSADALRLAALFDRQSPQRALLKKLIRVPRVRSKDFHGLSQVIAARYRP